MRRVGISAPLFPLAAALAGLTLGSGCDKEKSGAEKLADQLAAQNASASAAAKASASVPDPKEERYAKIRKQVRERGIAHMTALQKIYTGVPDAEVWSFREWFPSTKEGEKDADELAREAAFTGKEGMSIKRFDLLDVNFDAALTTGTTELFLEESQRGKPRCTTYKIDWKDIGGSWKRVARRDFRIVPCTQ